MLLRWVLCTRVALVGCGCSVGVLLVRCCSCGIAGVCWCVVVRCFAAATGLHCLLLVFIVGGVGGDGAVTENIVCHRATVGTVCALAVLGALPRR